MEGDEDTAYESLVTALIGMVPKEHLAEKDVAKYSARMYAKEYQRSDQVCKLLSVEEADEVGGDAWLEKQERDRKNTAYVRGLISMVFQEKKERLEIEEKKAEVRRLQLEQERLEGHGAGGRLPSKADEGGKGGARTCLAAKPVNAARAKLK